MADYTAGSVEVVVIPSFRRFKSDMAAATRSLGDLPINVKADADISKAKAKIDTLAASKNAAVVQVDADIAKARAKIAELESSRGTAKIDVDAEVSKAQARIDALTARREEILVRADADTAVAQAKIDALHARGNGSVTTKVNLDTSSADFSLSRLQQKIGAIGLAGGLGAALAPGALGGAIGGIGALGGALPGVVKALTTYKTSQDQASTAAEAGSRSAASMANAAHAQAVSVRNASDAIDTARRNQARTATDTARATADAERTVVEAETRVKEAHQGVTDAVKEATQARQDLADRVAGYAVTEEGASISLARAIERETKVKEDEKATDLDRREAANSVAEAQQRLADVQKGRAKDTAALNDLDKAGIEGSKQVIAARKQEQQAVTALQSAQRNQAVVAETSRRQQEDAAIAVAKAVQGLQDAQYKQAEASVSTTKAADKYKEALDNLSPAGRAFVLDLIGMKNAGHQFALTMQGATLPGFTRFLDGVHASSDRLTAGMGAVGNSISDVGDKAGVLFKNPVFQGRLEESMRNFVPVVNSAGDGVVKLTDRVVTFGAQNGQIMTSTADAVDSLFGGVIKFYDGLQPHVDGVSKTIESLGKITESIAGGIGVLTGQVASGYGSIGAKVATTIDEIIHSVTDFTATAIPAFANGFGVITDALRMLNSLLSPVMGFLGGVGGTIAASLLAFKLLSGAIGGVVGALSRINPESVAGRLEKSRLGKALSDTGDAADGADRKVSRVSSTFGKMGSAALSASKYIPLLGVVVASASEGFSNAAPGADTLAQKILQGGTAAAEARDKIAEHTKGLSEASLANKIFGASQDEVNAEIQKQLAAMTPLERAQQAVTAARNDLSQAESRYGANSFLAQDAARNLATATTALKDAQWAAEQATKSHADKIQDLQDAMLRTAGGVLGYQSAMQSVKQAQTDLSTAVGQYGATSDQAQAAQLRYQQSLLDSVTAAGSLSDAQTAGLAPSVQQAAHTDAINRQLVILATQAGGVLPPILQGMINQMDSNALAAFGATVRIDELGNKIVTMPGGKELKFPTDAPESKKRIDGLADSVNKVADAYGRWFTNYMDIINAPVLQPGQGGVSGGLNPGIPGMGTHATGGYIAGPGSGTSDSIPAWLSNGEFVVNAKATAANLPLLHSINAQRFAKGGRVGYADGGAVLAPVATTTPGATPAAGLPITPEEAAALTDAVTVLQAAITALNTVGLVPLWSQLTTYTIPSLQLFELHTGTLAVQSILALGAQLPPLQTGYTNTANIVTFSFQRMTTSAGQTTSQIMGYFGTTQTGLSNVGLAFSNTADWVTSSWARIRAAAADPVRWVLQNPFNAGIIAAWNQLDANFSMGKHVNPVPIGFATGGYVSGPGNGTSDSIPARLSNGEFVVPADVTKRALPFLEALRRGDAEALQATGARGYASGGLVADTGSQINAAIFRAMQFAKDQNGKPYIWGGVGPVGYDCSGYMSAITNVLRNEAPYRRLGVAASAPWPGFVRGLSSAFAMGSSSGHTAGTLNGVNVESGGSHGNVAFGGPAVGADHPQFPVKSSLPVVGGQFVPGGGGGFDPRPMIQAAFADTGRMIDRIPALFPGNLMGEQSGKIASQASTNVQNSATNQLLAAFSGGAGGAAGSPEVIAAVRTVAAKYGWNSGPQWDALSRLISGESGWNPGAANPTSSARGLFQKMTSVHGPIEPTPGGQAEWGLGYIKGKYGDPISAFSAWNSRSPHWYDEGGVLPPGHGTFYNGTGKEEYVLTNEQWKAVYAAAESNSGSGGEFRGNLYLSSGAFLGAVSGVIESHDNATGDHMSRYRG